MSGLEIPEQVPSAAPLEAGCGNPLRVTMDPQILAHGKVFLNKCLIDKVEIIN